jgi:hypothetical protein
MTLEEFKSECQAFIFNWHRTSANAKKLQKQFSDLDIETYVINSHEAENNNGLPNWINIGESGYMVQQYAKARETFNKKYFIEMFADIYDVNAKLIIERACYVFNKYNCGVYAPNIYFMDWVFDKSRLHKLEKHLYEVLNPESLLSIIHKDVLKEIFLDPVKYKYGWGIDFLVCLLANLQNKLVIRDYITTIKHPKGTAYDEMGALDEYYQYIKELGVELSALMEKNIHEAEDLIRKDVIHKIRGKLTDWNIEIAKFFGKNRRIKNS